MSGVNTVPLQKDPLVLERLEEDLLDKVEATLNGQQIMARLYGIFSLDDLEAQDANEIAKGDALVVGVGYMAGRNITVRPDPSKDVSVDMAEFRFMVLIANPVDPLCSQKHDATKLLSLLRFGIKGKDVTDSTRTQRRWQWVEEGPLISDSDRNVLYYTQVWRIVLPVLGT